MYTIEIFSSSSLMVIVACLSCWASFSVIVTVIMRFSWGLVVSRLSSLRW